jgi:hypothetical protein
LIGARQLVDEWIRTNKGNSSFKSFIDDVDDLFRQGVDDLLF